jgi:hypothetical protein
VVLEWGPLSLVRINEELLEKKSTRLPSRKERLTAVGVPPLWPSDTPLSVKVGTKIRRTVAVAESVYIVYGIIATIFFVLFL